MPKQKYGAQPPYGYNPSYTPMHSNPAAHLAYPQSNLNHNNWVGRTPTPYSSYYQPTMQTIHHRDPRIAQYAYNLPMQFASFGIQPGHKASICLCLDISSVMQYPNSYFTNGELQKLIDHLFALACLFDDDQSIEVFTFGTARGPSYHISYHNYADLAQRIYTDLSEITEPICEAANPAVAIQQIEKHFIGNSKRHFNTDIPSLILQQRLKEPHSRNRPVFAVVVSNGQCPAQFQEETEEQLIRASESPIFFKFLSLRGERYVYDTNNEVAVKDGVCLTQRVAHGQFEFMQKLDDLAVGKQARFTDNSDFVLLERSSDLSPANLLREYPSWCCEAYQRSMLKNDPKIDRRQVEQDGRTKNHDLTHKLEKGINKAIELKAGEKTGKKGKKTKPPCQCTLF